MTAIIEARSAFINAASQQPGGARDCDRHN